MDTPSECPTSPKRVEAEGEDGASERPDVGERDRDLDAWPDILRGVLGSETSEEGTPEWSISTEGVMR